MWKKIQVWISCLRLDSRPPKSGCFLENLLQSKFWNHFQAEIIPSSLLFFYFLAVFHMVWKNQESCESWLVGFWVIRHTKMPKISVNNFFFIFELLLWIYKLLWKLNCVVGGAPTSICHSLSKKWSKMTKNCVVTLHISGTIHHVIVIYGALVKNDNIFSYFFSFFQNFDFLGP